MNKRILVVDDDPALRTLLKLVATRAGFEVHTAGDGVEALELLAQNDYVIAVLDLMMPRLNGYDVVKKLSETTHRPAVVVVTAMTDTFIRGLDGNVVQSILRKPFDMEMFSTVLTELAEALRSQSRAATVLTFPQTIG